MGMGRWTRYSEAFYNPSIADEHAPTARNRGCSHRALSHKESLCHHASMGGAAPLGSRRLATCPPTLLSTRSGSSPAPLRRRCPQDRRLCRWPESRGAWSLCALSMAGCSLECHDGSARSPNVPSTRPRLCPASWSPQLGSHQPGNNKWPA